MTVCSACSQPRAEIKMTTSKVLPGIPVYMCARCLADGYEPRELIILAARERGLDEIKHYIRPARYHGDPILLAEVLNK